MKLENYEMHLPSYSIGDESYSKIVNVCVLMMISQYFHFLQLHQTVLQPPLFQLCTMMMEHF